LVSSKEDGGDLESEEDEEEEDNKAEENRGGKEDLESIELGKEGAETEREEEIEEGLDLASELAVTTVVVGRSE
jgi:hypothetical protein